MRQVFFLLSGLLLCLISSCTKENVSSFDDKFLKKWNVENSIYQRIGNDSTFEQPWEHTDSTSITYEFTTTDVLDPYMIIINDENLNFFPGQPDTLRGFWDKVDDDLIIVGDQSYKINYLTNTGMELEASRPFSSDPLFHTEKLTLFLKPINLD